MTYETFSRLLASTDTPVVLLEGTRALPRRDAPKLRAMGRRLATLFPTVRFRTGNAAGSDEAFAAGVATVDPTRLEFFLPYAGHRKRQRPANATAMAIDEVPASSLRKAVEVTVKASPEYLRPAERYRDGEATGREQAIAQMILRDTFKVTGTTELARPVAGLFFVNTDDPEKGGTGHTIRVCRVQGVPAITQAHWMGWPV